MNMADEDLRVQAQALRDGTASSEELVREHLARIERHADLGSLVHLDADGAMAAAR